MKGKMKRLLAVALSLMLVLPLQMFGGVTAYADDLEGNITVLTENHLVYLYNTNNTIDGDDLDYCGKTYSGISFNAQTKTLTLQNVNLPNDPLCIDIHDDVEIKVNLVGTNKIRSIDGHCDLNFTGSGSLSFENMLNMAGKITFSDSTVVSVYGIATSAIAVGPQATLTIKQPKTAFNKGFNPDAADNTLINFVYANYYVESTNGLISYSGNVSETIKWKTNKKLYNEDEKLMKEKIGINYYATSFSPDSNVYIAPANRYIYAKTYHEIGTSSLTDGSGYRELTELLYDEGSDTWKEIYDSDATVTNRMIEEGSISIDPEFENQYLAYNDTNKAMFPSTISGNTTINAYICTNNYFSDEQVYKKDNKKYLFVYKDYINPSYPTPYDSKYIVSEIKTDGNFQYLLPVEGAATLPNSSSDYKESYIDDPDFVPEYIYHKYVINNSLVFSPKQDTAGASTETSATVKGAQYVITTTSDGKQTAEYKAPVDNKAKDVTIPATIDLGNGKKASVTSIGAKAFANNKNVKSVKIENGVMTIEAEAFSNCSNLTNVTIPKSTKTIGRNAFKNCKSMKSVKFKGNNVETIESGAFSGCKKLANVTLTKNVKSVKANAFAGTSKLTKVTIKSIGVKIAKNAFKGHKNTKVYIPKKLKGKAKTNFVKMLTKAGFKKKNIKAK